MQEKGYVHVYTGAGKGKTTAALGLVLRALGAGFRVFIAQFLKSGAYSEVRSLERFGDQVTLRQYGTGRFVNGEPTDEDRAHADRALRDAEQAIRSGEYHLVMLDEANVALHYGLISLDQLLGLIEMKPPSVELVITGRHAVPELIDSADLVTEMREVKHYASTGVKARKGIEK